MRLILLKAVSLHNTMMIISSLQFQITAILQIYNSLKYKIRALNENSTCLTRVNIYLERMPSTKGVQLLLLEHVTPPPR